VNAHRHIGDDSRIAGRHLVLQDIVEVNVDNVVVVRVGPVQHGKGDRDRRHRNALVKMVVVVGIGDDNGGVGPCRQHLEAVQGLEDFGHTSPSIG